MLENFYKEIIHSDDEGQEIGRELQPPPHNFVTPDGRTIINFHLNPGAMLQYGWREWTEEELEEWHSKYDPPVPVYERQRCTKYQLVTCLRNFYPSLLPTLRAAYAGSADLAFYWNTVNDLDKNNEDFKIAQQALGITDEQVKEIFSKIEGEEPAALEA